MQLVHILSNAGSEMFSLSQKTKAKTLRPLSAAIGGDVSHVATANDTDNDIADMTLQQPTNLM